MKLRFFQTRKLVLCPFEQGVDWIYTPVWFQQMNTVETGRLHCERGNYWEQVASFMQQQGWENAQIVIRLEPRYVRHFFVEGEAVESREEFDRWMTESITSQLSPGIDVSKFVCRSKVLFQNEVKIQCVVGLVRRSYIDTELAAMHKVGIYPVVLWGAINKINGVSEKISDLTDEFISTESKLMQNVHDYAFNFLSETDQKAIIRKREKKLAMKIVLAGGCLVVLLLSIIFGIQLKVEGSLAISEKKLELLDSQIGVLDQQKRTVQNLAAKLERGRRFIRERTALGLVLSGLGRSIPKNVWLDELKISVGDQGDWEVLLQGTAINVQGVSELLGRLERLENVNDVKLVVSELVPAQQRYKQEGVRNLSLTRYDVLVEVKRLMLSGNDVLQTQNMEGPG